MPRTGKLNILLGAVALVIALAGFALSQTGYAGPPKDPPTKDKDGNGLVIPYLGF